MRGPTKYGRETVLGVLLQALTLAVLTVTAGWAQEVPSFGTIIIAHGADEAWNAPVLEIASQVHTDGPVEVSFLMGRRPLPTDFRTPHRDSLNKVPIGSLSCPSSPRVSAVTTTSFAI